MIEKTEALVLRIAPFSKTSHIVTWFTPDYGKLSTVVKGACRPKSMFLGQYDLFYTCELLFYTREHNGLHIIKECSAIKTRQKFRSAWKQYSIASYICDLASRVSLRGHHQPELYQLLDKNLDYLCVNPAKLQFLLWFELMFIKTIGFSPQLTKCLTCGIDLGPTNSSNLFFSYIDGGVICRKCGAHRQRELLNISGETLAMLRSWQKSISPRVAQNTNCTPSKLTELQNLFGMFLNYHLDFLPKSRKISFELVSANIAPEKQETKKSLHENYHG